MASGEAQKERITEERSKEEQSKGIGKESLRKS